uniref:FAD linked oxidase domain protein n=1 Tax=Caulobacter sp. (strain K31) TaxID=366602 RepID=B0T105_CAUSK
MPNGSNTTRRTLLAALLALPAATALSIDRAVAAVLRRARPGTPEWPTDAQWTSLGRAVGGRLQPVVMPRLDGPEAEKLLSDPFHVGDQAALTQSSGWLDGWRSAPSAYVVRAEQTSDVAQAVRFAAAHRLRLVVRGGGHSYLGGSNAPDSLLVWTRGLRDIALHDGFTPEGSQAAPVPAVSVGAGCLWVDVYDAVTTKAGRYVQGGGCTTVGVAGLVQGGGFGSFSKGFGLAAASLLEAEIVTADGAVHVVNAHQEPDLFWALKGGGGGTFGVVTRLTLRTHDLPQTLGAVFWNVQAKSDEAYRALIARFVDHYATHLLNPHWGEQVRARPDNRLDVQMVFQGLDVETARAAWQDLVDFVKARPQDYQAPDPAVLALPARHFWNPAVLAKHVPGAIKLSDRPGARPGDYWWAGDGDQVGAFWHAYTSAWLPAALLNPDAQGKLVDAWFAASRHWSVAFHFNKGLAGAAPSTIAASRDTAMNPQVLEAFALAIIADCSGPAFAGMPGPNLAEARDNAARVQAATAALKAAAPDAGGYLSECDFFTPGWQASSWGRHWARLRDVKQRYDPNGLFVVHHGVGSEAWSEDGFTRRAS